MVQDKELVKKILHSMNRIFYVEKRRVIRFEDIQLYPSEAHFILFIHMEQDTNITEIGQRLGLTKGAVSQTLTRLEGKGILNKSADPYKKNQLHITFTPKGEQLLGKIIELKERLHREYMEYVRSLSDSEKETVSQFIDKMLDTMEKKH